MRRSSPKPSPVFFWYALAAKNASKIELYQAVSPSLINRWWAQTMDQAQLAGLVPMLAYRGDRLPWAVVIPLHVLVGSTTGAHTETLSIEAFSTFLQQHVDNAGTTTQTAIRSNSQ